MADFPLTTEGTEGVTPITVEGGERDCTAGVDSMGAEFRTPGTTSVMVRHDKLCPLSHKVRQADGRGSATSSSCMDVNDSERSSFLADVSDNAGFQKNGSSRRLKRSKPAITGEYVGVAAARAKKLALDRQALELQAEREVAEAVLEQRNLRSTSRAVMSIILERHSGPMETALSSINLEKSRVGDLVAIARGDLDVILRVAAILRSSDLKGTFVRFLKDAVSSLRGVIDVIGHCTCNDETRRLKAANARLWVEVDNLRQELVSMRCQLTPSVGRGRLLSFHPRRTNGRWWSITMPPPPPKSSPGRAGILFECRGRHRLPGICPDQCRLPTL